MTRRIAIGWALSLVAMTLGGMAAPPAGADVSGWSYVNTGIAASLNAVACPTTSHCWAVSPTKIIATSNGGSSWTTQLTSPPTSLDAVACASSSACWVAGYNQTSNAIMNTTNGGSSWATQFSGPLGGTYDSIDGMTCPTTSRCWAVGTGNTPGFGYQASILTTSNGGSTWTRQYLGSNTSWDAVSCPSTTTCYVAGWAGVAKTTNAGSSWTDVDGGSFFDARSISCPSTTTCWAMTLSGAVWFTSNSGSSWSKQVTRTTGFMRGIACPNTSSCIAVGEDGQVIGTTNGGQVWLPQISHTTSDLRAIACPSTSMCLAVADDGTVIKTTNFGAGPGENRPPNAPTLIDPPANSVQSAQFPPIFTIRATDPDSTTYSGSVTVRNAATGVVVATFATAPAQVGSNSTGSPPLALPAGSYTWTAHAVDDLGLAGPESGAWSFTVV